MHALHTRLARSSSGAPGLNGARCIFLPALSGLLGCTRGCVGKQKPRHGSGREWLFRSGVNIRVPEQVLFVSVASRARVFVPAAKRRKVRRTFNHKYTKAAELGGR